MYFHSAWKLLDLFFFFFTDFLHLTEQIDTFQLDNASATLASSLPLFSDRTICRDWHGRPNKELRSQPLLERRLQGMWCRSKLTSGWICDRQKYLEPSNLHTQVSCSPSSPPQPPAEVSCSCSLAPHCFRAKKGGGSLSTASKGYRQGKKRLAVKTQPINSTSSHQLDSNFCKSKYKTN